MIRYIRSISVQLLVILAIMPGITLTGIASPHLSTTQADWLQFGYDPQHSGNNPQENTITSANVANLRRVIQVSLAGVADGAPAYLSGVTTAYGVRNLLFLNARNGTLQALDASTGFQIWSQQVPAGSCRINNGSSVCYTTSSPAVDPDRQYVYAYGLDGFVHKYQVGDGVEIKTGGWPELATTKPNQEKGSSNLSIAIATNNVTYLYVANGGYPGDRGDYQGHVTAIDLATGAQQVFNAVCSNQTVHFVETPALPDCPQVQTAVWARPGVVYNPENNRIYLATGNGTYDPSAYDWGDSVLALNPNGSGSGGNPLDSYTPSNYAALQASDADLGSTAPAILPTPKNSNVAHLAVQGGKDSKLRLINLDDLSGQAGPGHTGGEIGTPVAVPQGGAVLTQPAVWVNPANQQTWVFVATSSGLSGLKLEVDINGNPSLVFGWKTTHGGTSPVVANDVLYYAGSGLIQALNPLDGSTLWSNNTIGSIHWESPIVVNGMLYITDESGHLTIFSLYGQIPGFNNHAFLPVIEK